jgi:phosphoglycolate phosphatase
MTYDAVIFDIDGTLWNASSASAKGWNFGLESLGVHQKITAKQMEAVAGNPYECCVDILLPGRRGRHPDLLDVLNKHEAEAVSTEGGEFYSGVIDGIIRLAYDYRIFLVSNCQEWYLNRFLHFSRLGPVLTGVDCYGMSGLPKNEMLVRIKRDYSLRSVVYVGDTASDEKAAALAGIVFIHVAWGFGKPEGTPRTVRSFAELLDYFNGTIDRDGSNKAVQPIAPRTGSG